jgi:23S rRNA (adenine2503-C2)-methyltransferase
LLSILDVHGTDDLARIYLAYIGHGRHIEFVDAVDPRYPRAQKWCINVSTQAGCPVGCIMCDAGRNFVGNLTTAEILAQIRYVIDSHPELHPDSHPKLKIHLARMGEPLLNTNIIDALTAISERFPFDGVMPCIATVAPVSQMRRLERVGEVKSQLFSHGRFQLQFSVNSTDDSYRHRMIPTPTLSFAQMAEFGLSYFEPGDRKINLNFALSADSVVDPDVLSRYFDPTTFIVKLTPINPTLTASENGVVSRLTYDHGNEADSLVEKLRERGFEVIISIGAPGEIELGSNCGQMVAKWTAMRAGIAATPAVTPKY